MRQGGDFDFALKPLNFVNPVFPKPSREAASEYSPRRKPWVKKRKTPKPQSGERNSPLQPRRLISQQRQRQPVLVLRLRAPDLGLRLLQLRLTQLHN